MEAQSTLETRALALCLGLYELPSVQRCVMMCYRVVQILDPPKLAPSKASLDRARIK